MSGPAVTAEQRSRGAGGLGSTQHMGREDPMPQGGICRKICGREKVFVDSSTCAQFSKKLMKRAFLATSLLLKFTFIIHIYMAHPTKSQWGSPQIIRL